LVYYSIVGDFNRLSLHPINDERWLILRRIFILVMISIVSGSMLMWLIFPSPPIICLNLFIKIFTLIVCILGGLFGYYVSNVSLYFNNKSLRANKIISFFIIIWFMPFISTVYISKLPLNTGFIIKSVDQGWREYFGSNNLFRYLIRISKIYQIIHLNNIKLYLLRFILWLVLIFIFILLYLNSLCFRV
jgi:NADH-ubiquinone oxidoreductase chain 5